jgi:copper homeostasis protein
MGMMFQLEICCFNYESCLIAERAGAQRVELCTDPADGGTTPAFGTIKQVKEKTSIPVYPIIRPRGGDFFYNDDEFTMMKSDVLLCRELGCDGVVIGLLNLDGSIDKERSKRLVQLAYPMGVTFHRAFDRAIHPFEALEDVIETGCERILTSGQLPTAMEGIQMLNELVRQANDRIIIMPGSGIRASNIETIAKQTGVEEFHSSARISLPSSMEFVNNNMKEYLTSILADEKEIVAMKQVLTAYFSSIAVTD